MKKTFKLINELMVLVEEFRESGGEDKITLELFLLWLNRKVLLNNRILTHIDPDENKFQLQHGPRVNVKLSLLLHELSKHFKMYSKKVLMDSDLVNMDGHNFLSSLYRTNSMRKMELIKSNYMETPTGIEIINRLLRKGFIEEFDDPEDKRSKRVKITYNGKAKYQETLPYILKVINIMAGRLDNEKKLLLVSLLDELNNFHLSFHEEAKKETLDQLLDNHVNP
jgi:DNA-binding MarR family transcriptional regulator